MGWSWSGAWKSFKTVLNQATETLIGFARVVVTTTGGAVIVPCIIFVGILLAANFVAEIVNDAYFSEVPIAKVLEDFSSIASINEFDYHATIHRSDVHICSGALIAATFILTVGQCVYKYVNDEVEKSKLKVYVAEMTVPILYGGGYDVENITLHPNFYSTRLAYNVAVLKLTEKVTKPPEAYAIALPNPRVLLKEKTKVLVGGFILRKMSEFRTKMTKSNMIVIDHENCSTHFAYKIVTSGKFCVIPADRWPACQTGPGGVAVTDNGILVGLYVMKNPRGCAKNLPEIFVEVSKFMDFIRNTMENSIHVPSSFR